MAEQFYTILTNTGKAKIANSVTLGTKVNLTTLKVGDSNGAYYNPSESQTDLVHSVYSCNITSVEIDETNSNWINVVCAIPSDVGDFYIREAGVFDDTGALIAIGKYPETYKPTATDGSTKELYIKMTLEVTNTSSVELKIDPTVILATKSDINTLTTSMNNSIASINASLSDIVKVDICNYKNLVTNNDWSLAFSTAITANPNCEIFVPSSETSYNISSPVVLGKFNSLNIQRGATIKAIASMDMVIQKHNEGGYTFSVYNSIVGGGTVECNSLEKVGISLEGYRYFNLQEIRVQNPLEIGIKTRAADGVFAIELMATNLYICMDKGNTTRGAIGILANVGDSHFINIITVNMDIGIKTTSGGNKFFNCHDWVYDTDKLDNHLGYVDESDGFWNTCYSDTATTSWTISGNSLLLNCSIYQSSEFPISSGSTAFDLTNLGTNKVRIYNCTVTGSSNSVVNKLINVPLTQNIDIQNIKCNGYVLDKVPKANDYYISSEYAGGTNTLYNFATIRIPTSRAGSAMSGKFVIMPNSANSSSVSSINMELAFWIKAYVDADSNYTDSNILVRVTNLDSYLDGKIRVSKTTVSGYVEVRFYFVMSGTWQIINFTCKDLIGGHGMGLNKPAIQKLEDNVGILLLMNENKALELSITGTEVSVIPSRLSINNIYMNGYNIWVDANGVPRLQSGDKASDTSGQPIMRAVMPPSTSSSSGTLGMVAFNPSYFYICVGTNQWVRTALASW